VCRTIGDGIEIGVHDYAHRSVKHPLNPERITVFLAYGGLNFAARPRYGTKATIGGKCFADARPGIDRSVGWPCLPFGGRQNICYVRPTSSRPSTSESQLRFYHAQLCVAVKTLPIQLSGPHCARRPNCLANAQGKELSTHRDYFIGCLTSTHAPSHVKPGDRLRHTHSFDLVRRGFDFIKCGSRNVGIFPSLFECGLGDGGIVTIKRIRIAVNGADAPSTAI